jgi:hypothetical protein
MGVATEKRVGEASVVAPNDWVGKRVTVYLDGEVWLEAAEGLQPIPSAAIDGELLEKNERA